MTATRTRPRNRRPASLKRSQSTELLTTLTQAVEREADRANVDEQRVLIAAARRIAAKREGKRVGAAPDGSLLPDIVDGVITEAQASEQDEQDVLVSIARRVVARRRAAAARRRVQAKTRRHAAVPEDNAKKTEVDQLDSHPFSDTETRKPDATTSVDGDEHGGISEGDLTSGTTTEDVESGKDNAQTDAADRPDSVNDGSGAKSNSFPVNNGNSTVASAEDGEIEIEAGAEIPGEGSDDDEDHEEQTLGAKDDDEDEDEPKEASIDKSARLMQIFSFVEEREQAGLSTRANRVKEIARFEAMTDDKLAGHVEAFSEYKAVNRTAGRRVASTATAKTTRLSGRVPNLGRPTERVAAAASDEDPMDDSLALL